MSQTTETRRTIREEIEHLEREVTRYAREFLKEPICPANMKYHMEILDKQVALIRERRELKKLIQ